MLQRVELFQNKKEFFWFLSISLLLFSLQIGWEYYNYTKLNRFDSALVEATVIKQYHKTKQTKRGSRHYQVLKLKAKDGFVFYIIGKKNLANIINQKVKLEIWPQNLDFLSYLRGFFSYGKILEISRQTNLRTTLLQKIDAQHLNTDIADIYAALFLAFSLPHHLQQQFSQLGISHLVAISGFHLGVLATLLYGLFQLPYTFFQKRYFPYRFKARDTFFLLGFVLLLYLLFLDAPPSLLRAYGMFLVGFFLYDRGIEILSFQTLFVTVVLLVALFPKLLFSLGFWLSVAGVYYIFLFLHHFADRSKLWIFWTLPFYIYVTMLPYSLTFFGTFSLTHPLSILYTTLFTIFYPLALLLHLVNMGDLFDPLLTLLLESVFHPFVVSLPKPFFIFYVGVSLLSVRFKRLFYLSFFLALGVLGYTLSQS